MSRFTVHHGDCLDWLRGLPSDSVHCCVTSPPYFALRSYLPKGHPLKAKEIGAEPTPAAFVATMVAVFREVRRVLHPTGTLWLNLGDSFHAGKSELTQSRADAGFQPKQATNGHAGVVRRQRVPTLKPGDLCGIPWAVAFALREDGWLLRSATVWHRLAPMPESVSGWRWERCRVKAKEGAIKRHGVNGAGRESHGESISERDGAQWQDCPGCKKCEANDGLVLRRGSWRPTKSYEMVFLLAKNSDYFADGEPVRTPLASATVSRDQYSRITEDNADEQYAVKHDHETVGNAGGANLRDVWSLGPQPQTDVKHYAMMAPEVARRCILAGTSERGVCPACGWPWARVLQKGDNIHPGSTRTTTLGWRPTCDCPAHEPSSAVVMDPFAGSGTTLLAATRLGRRAIGCDLSEEYVVMARRRLSEDMPLFVEYQS